MVVKTSETDPLRIDRVEITGISGVIGITLCPGKKIDSLFGWTWDRDLDTDMQAIKAWGTDAFVTLLEDHEFEMLSVCELPDVARKLGMEYYHLPIPDVSVPDSRFKQEWNRVGPKLKEILKNGGKLVIHCRGGLGRSGMIAAQLMVELGTNPEEAIIAVRTARPKAIETSKQEQYVLQCAPDTI